MKKDITSAVIICLTATLSWGQAVPPAGTVGGYTTGSDYTQTILARLAPSSPYFSYPTRQVNTLSGYTQPATLQAINKYGSWAAKKDTAPATGFYRVKKIAGRWWVIDPDGYYNINMSIACLAAGTSKRNKTAFTSKYGGSLSTWIAQSNKLLRDNGFNGAGAWSDETTIKNSTAQSTTPLAYTTINTFMATYWNQRSTYEPGHPAYTPGLNSLQYCFDPGFAKFCDAYAKNIYGTYKNDKNCFGHYSDNELPFFASYYLDGFLALKDKTDPGYLAAKQWLDDRCIAKEEINDSHRKLFLQYACDQYYSVVSAAIKKYDPNHMYLGSRMYSVSSISDGQITSAGKYMDILAINMYTFWTPDLNMLAHWEFLAKKPILISEFYTKGEDSGLPNIGGAGIVVKTQVDRGRNYQDFCLALLESKNCVGWQYFRYQDNDPTTCTNPGDSNCDSNKGIVDNDYNTWVDMVGKKQPAPNNLKEDPNTMKVLNTNVYDIINYFDTK